MVSSGGTRSFEPVRVRYMVAAHGIVETRVCAAINGERLLDSSTGD